MKRSERLLDAIGQIDDALVAEAVLAGNVPGDGKEYGKGNEKADKEGNKKGKRKKRYRWQSALAACAVLVICVGVIGLLSREGLLLAPISHDSAEEELAEEAAAAEVVAEDAVAEEAAAEEGNAEAAVAEDESINGVGRSKTEASAVTDDSTSGVNDLAEPDGGSRASGQSLMQDVAILTVQESSEESVALLIENVGEQELFFGAAFELEQLVEGSWQTVTPEKEVGWEETAIVVDAGGSYEETVALDSFYGVLQQGQYRIRKTYQLMTDGIVEEEIYTMYGEFAVGE